MAIQGIETAQGSANQESEQSTGTAPELVPARMLNEYAYCPRLAYLEWVQGEFADSADTVEGRFQHRRVDHPSGKLPSRSGSGAADIAEEDGEYPETIHARSVLLSDDALGAIARIDLIEGQGGAVTPVDYKHGAAPDVPEGAWGAGTGPGLHSGPSAPRQRLQLNPGNALLRGVPPAGGGALRRRPRIAHAGPAVRPSRHGRLRANSRAPGGQSQVPQVLPGRHLPPGEVNFLSPDGPSVKPEDVRRLSPARDDAVPVYVQTQGAVVGKAGGQLEVKQKGQVLQKVRLMEISHLALFGNVQVTAQAVQELCDRDIPICYFSYGGWFRGITSGMGHKNVELRCRQYLAAMTPETALSISRRMVFGKIKNSRAMLRRNHREPPPSILPELNRLADRALSASSLETLLGIEGAAARTYFSEFRGMIKNESLDFDFRGRNRRPPKDPVNAVLSFLYAMLIQTDDHHGAHGGLRPVLGFYHQPRYGRPALALDLVEEFRPLIADSVCLGLINNGELGPEHFITRGAATALTRTAAAGLSRAMNAAWTPWSLTHCSATRPAIAAYWKCRLACCPGTCSAGCRPIRYSGRGRYAPSLSCVLRRLGFQVAGPHIQENEGN